MSCFEKYQNTHKAAVSKSEVKTFAEHITSPLSTQTENFTYIKMNQLLAFVCSVQCRAATNNNFCY